MKVKKIDNEKKAELEKVIAAQINVETKGKRISTPQSIEESTKDLDDLLSNQG